MIEVGLLETLAWPGNRKKGSRLDEHFSEGLLHTWHRTLVSQPLSDGTLSPVASQQTFYNFWWSPNEKKTLEALNCQDQTIYFSTYLPWLNTASVASLERSCHQDCPLDTWEREYKLWMVPSVIFSQQFCNDMIIILSRHSWTHQAAKLFTFEQFREEWDCSIVCHDCRTMQKPVNF